MSTPPRRNRNRPAVESPPARERDDSDEASDDPPVTEQSPLRRTKKDDNPSSSPRGGLTKAQERTAARRAARAGASERVNTDDRDDDEYAGSGDDEPAAPASAASKSASPKKDSSVISSLKRRIGGRFGGASKKSDTAASASSKEGAADDDDDDDDDGEDDKDDTEKSLVSSKKKAPTADEQEERARLALGLTQCAPPTLMPSLSAERDAELFRTPADLRQSWLGRLLSGAPRDDQGSDGQGEKKKPRFWRSSSTTTLYAQPIAELGDGLHVESMPKVSTREQQRHAERLGPEFQPASKARRLAPSVVLRQPDPVRHVRVRPSHPGMRTPVGVERDPPSTHLVDAASRASGEPHTLQVSVGLVQLHDHPLFREEHVLQRRLRSLAEQLGELHRRETLLICRRRVDDLRRRVEPHLSAARPSSAEEATRVRALCTELLDARLQRDEHECAERLLARRMLHLWQQLKEERRRNNNARSTRAKLQVQLVQEEDEATAELEQELEERRLLHLLEAGTRSDPDDFDEVQERVAVEERHRSRRRAPGEQTLVPVYTEDTPGTDTSELPPKERSRLLDAAQIILYAVVLVDGRVVGQTETARNHPLDFCARFNTSIQLQLLQAPRTLSLQLWERRSFLFGDALVSEVFLAVPETASPAAPRWSHYSFASERTFAAAEPQAQSAAERLESEIAVHSVRCICGQVNVAVSWASQPAAKQAAANASAAMPSYTSLTSRGDAALHSGSLDTARVRNHVRPEDLDPNAPSDVPLLALLKRGGRGGRVGGFRAFRFGREMQLIKEWLFSERQQLLQLRRDRPHEWQLLPPEARAVPARASAEMASDDPRKIMLSGGAAALKEEEDDDGTHLSEVRKWAKGVLAKQQRAKTGNQFVLTTTDVVREPLLEVEVPPFDLNAFLEKTFAHKGSSRRLRPTPRARKAELASADTPRTVEVVVVQGVDLPQRAGSFEGARTRLFIEVGFQGATARTEVKATASPIWNQRLSFPLVVPNGDWSQQALINLSADVTFNLFDRMEGVSRDVRETNVRTLREEQRWLGSFTLPFSSLYRAGEVKGLFPLNMPPILLGYAKDARSASRRLVPNAALQLFVTVEPLLPALKGDPTERFSKENVPMQAAAVAWIKARRRDAAKRAPGSRERKITLFAPTATGEKRLVCAFVRPQPPPPRELMPQDERAGSEAARLLRFVSLVPFLDDGALGMSLDVWNTTKSFLDLCAGDAEEHALLLCNMFKATKGMSRAYIVLGTQMPEGETSYVLTRDGGDIKLWDASKGKCYSRDSATDPLSSCPLCEIGCVFDDNNVWANVQAADRPADMEWQLSDEKNWKPFFAEEVVGGRLPEAAAVFPQFPKPKTLQSVQSETLEYRRTTEEYRAMLEDKVEEKLKDEFEDLRAGIHKSTEFQKGLEKILKKLLKRFENAAAGGPEITQAEHDAQLERVLATYSLQGFPIHTSMSAPDADKPENIKFDFEPLLQRLKNTNLWLADGKEIKFALTAHVHAYPNNVTSVWVYAAALKDNRAPE